jgi:hypothetical protein
MRTDRKLEINAVFGIVSEVKKTLKDTHPIESGGNGKADE